ncbi:hypothetical protein AB595_04605 [Massilia sp. WF1]|uniref:hypothetical protein n=1 Tax=unclassified Massilia TaxID=2609279 RepID=UPI000649CC00|nr:MULTISPECIES: hypothetical protein [unclassified Massilia]ALK96958.1 hypothetical protein AM586_12505 [Massilia sp. WG5]KLU37911.1 hypothetical protein AB595_04605 [Massilia sp. WF1]
MPVYVQHETLARINDVFSPEAIWQAPGLALFSRRPLLRDLLERAPREQRGRAATRCFSHVTLALPQEEVDDDRHLTRGARVRDLAQGLAALHQKDFGDLLGGDEVRYHVVGAEDLAPGEVEVRFGHAVYLPAPDEKLQYTVSVSRDSAVWKTVCPVYPNQRLTLIGHDEHETTHAAPGWPFGAEGAILLINDGPEAPLEVQVRPKDAFECSFDAAGGYYTIRSRRGGVDASGAPLRLLLRITPAPGARAMSSPSPSPSAPARGAAAPVQAPLRAPSASTPAPSSRPAVWKPRQSLEADMTAVPLARPAPAAIESDATYAPVARQRVALAALALPRLSRYRETGAQALEIGLNRALAPSAPGAETVLGFAVDDADVVHAVTAAGREPVSAPAAFSPFDGARVELLAAAPEMADRYLGLLRLPQAPALPVAPGARFLFGRGAPMLAGLRVLDSPRFLRAGPGTPASSADRLGLSRNAFSFEAGPDGYRIARASATQALYHLDEQLRFVAAIGEATPEQPYRLPPGHHLVAGHYVLRFDA